MTLFVYGLFVNTPSNPLSSFPLGLVCLPSGTPHSVPVSLHIPSSLPPSIPYLLPLLDKARWRFDEVPDEGQTKDQTKVVSLALSIFDAMSFVHSGSG
jgi:hypothetical protein